MPHYLKAMHETAHGQFELWTVPRGMLVVVFFVWGDGAHLGDTNGINTYGKRKRSPTELTLAQGWGKP